MIKHTIISLTAAVGLTMTAHAQQIGVSTTKNVEAVFGKPVFDPTNLFRGYIYDSKIIGVAYDRAGICQAVIVYSPQGDRITKEEAEKYDNLCLPVGDYNWVSIPTEKIPVESGNEIMSAYYAFQGGNMLIVGKGFYYNDGSAHGMRVYGTLEGAELMKQYGNNNWVKEEPVVPKSNIKKKTRL